MKNYKIWLAIVLMLLAVNSIVLAIMWFHKKPELRPMPDERRLAAEPKDILIQTLALTAKQQELFTVMRNKHRQTTLRLNRENYILRDSLFGNIKKPVVDSGLINTLTKKISENQVGLEKVTLYHFRELRAILTDEQKIKFDNIIGEVIQMMGRPGAAQGPPRREDNINDKPDANRPQDRGHDIRHRNREGRPHFGPPRDGMPPPGDERRDHRPPPPPDGMPPGPDGPPPGGPPPDRNKK